MAFLRSLPGIDLMPPTKIQQISLPELLINYNFKEVPRYDRCQTCHQGIDRIGYDKDADGKDMPSVFKSHPFLTTGATTVDPRGKVVKAGLYLDANGPHPINSFGCTICHGGQGSGTDFTFASHSPDSLKQAEDWEKEHDWQRFPLLGLPDAPQAVHRVDLPEMPHPDHRHPAGDQAAGRISADRQVRMHRLPCDRRRRLDRPRPLRRAPGRAQPVAHRGQERQGVGASNGSPIPTRSGPTRECRGSTA